MAEPLTRRGLVAAAPAVIATAAVPVLTAGGVQSMDTLLFAWREPYERTLAAINAVSPVHNRAEVAYIAAQRAQPNVAKAVLAKATGFDQAEQAWDRVIDDNTAVLDQITATPARSFEGLLFKARACAKAGHEAELAWSIVDDILAMGGINA